jgi:hypothetical protein
MFIIGLLFTSLDDDIIKTMKGKEPYNLLKKNKGEYRVMEREDFLLANLK